MIHKVLLLLLSLLIYSCGIITLHKKEDSPAVPASKPKKLIIKKKPKISKKEAKKATLGVFHNQSGFEMGLIVERIDDQLLIELNLSEEYNPIEMKEGHWRVKGIVYNGATYRGQNTENGFIFKIKKNKSNYSGSFILECPKVTNLGIMKEMSFFNRYQLLAQAGVESCELVIGNKYTQVSSEWSKNYPLLPKLKLGF